MIDAKSFAVYNGRSPVGAINYGVMEARFTSLSIETVGCDRGIVGIRPSPLIPSPHIAFVFASAEIAVNYIFLA